MEIYVHSFLDYNKEHSVTHFSIIRANNTLYLHKRLFVYHFQKNVTLNFVE